MTRLRIAMAGRSFWCCAFACLALPVCLAFALRVPIGEVADEAAHLARAVALTEGQLVGHRQIGRAHV